MAKASLWTRVKKKVGKWLSGDDNRKATPPKPRAVAVNRDARNQTVSSSVNKRAFVSSLNDTKKEQKEEKRVQDAFKASKQTYKSMAEAVSNSKSDSTKTPPKPKTSLEKLDATLKKDVPKDPKAEAAQKSHDNLQNTLEERRRKKQMARAEYKDYKERVGRDARHEAFHEATHHRYDVAQEGISDEERKARRQAVRTAPLYEMMHGRDDEALDVAKAKMKYEKRSASALRGAANIASASTVDFAANKSKGGYKEAEEYYQENKDPLAEGIGSLVGGALLYGGTAPTFDALGMQGVERAAATQIGKKLGAEKLAKLMAGKGAKSAFVRSLVGSGLQDSSIGLVDSVMRTAQRDDLETPSDYLKEVAKWQGLNYLYGLGGNAIFHGLPAAGRAWSNFADESRRLYAVPKDVADIAETTAKSAPPKPTLKAAMAGELDDNAGRALSKELSEIDDEWWEIGNSIKDDYGDINPDFKKLTPEERADIISRKTRMKEINARKNEILEIRKTMRDAERGIDTNAPAETVAKELDETAEVKPKSKTKSKSKTETKGEPKAEAEAEVKSKSKTKSESKKSTKADNSRYDELMAERKQILDEYMSKNERMDDATAERLKEINAELDNIKPPKTKGKGKKTKAEAPKQEMKLPDAEAKAPETKGVKEAAKTLEPKAEKAAKAEVSEVKAEAKEAAKTSKVKKYEVQVEDSKGDFHKVTVEAESSSKARRAAMAEVNESLDHDVSVVDGKTLGRVEETAKVENVETKAKTQKAKTQKTKTQKTKTQSKGVKETAETLEPKATKGTKGKKVKSEPAGEGNVVEESGAKTESKNATQKAEPKDFDKDFAEFKKKVGNAKSEILELENKLRVAETKEQKEAIKAQIKALKDDVKKAHNKAGLRYHPDKGGSAEQMAKFNEAYDTFVNGGNGGGAGGSKNVKPTRNVKKVEDIVNKTKEGRSAKEDVENAWQAARRSTTNSMVTFEDTNLKTIKTDYEGWKSRNASVDKARRYNALATRSVSEGQLRADGTRYSGTVERVGADGKTYQIQNGKSLQEIYAGLDADKEAAFDAYLLLRHAPDRIREATPIFKRINLVGEDGSIIKSLDDPEVVKEYADKLLSENSDFARRAEELYQYEQNELENRVRASLMSQKTASKWMHDHPFYVPTGRDGYFNAAHGNHKGVVGADSIKAATGSDLDIRSIKEQLAEATSRNWRDITTNELLEEFFGSEIAAGRSDTKGLKMLNDTFGLSKSADGRKFYAKIFREGKMHRVEISKNHYYDLVDLYKNGRLGGDGAIGDVMDTVARATSKVSTPFKKLVTTWNPIFLPKNFSRDMQDALINTRQTKEFVECLAPAWKQLREGGEYARAFEDSGVSQANFVNLGESLNRGGKLGKAVDKFIALQDMTESFPRLAEYMATLKKAGVDISKPLSEQNVSPKLLDIAAANAADVTVNFGRSGSVGKNLNKGLVPFLNPSIQGWSKFVRNFREHQSTKQLLGVIAKATALGAGVMGVNNFLLSDNPNYQQISNREKATNIIIAIPPFKDGHINNDADTFIKIPRGRFATVYGLATVNAFNDNEMGWAEMIKVARDQVLPVDPTESSIVAPLYAAHKNETWYGAPIESDYLVENFSPSERYDERTTPLGKALGKATSGLPEELQISPKKADYMIDAATGVVGDFGMPIATAFGNKGGISDVPAAGVGVLKKAFTIDSATQNGLTSQYNAQKELLTHKKNGANASEADEKAYDKFGSWDSRVKAASNAMRYVQNSDLPNKQEAYRELAKLRNDNMQKALNGKRSINNARDVDIIHKYAGTSYTIENLGKSADQKALKAYSAAVYGNLPEDEMRKRIDSDTEFYKGYKGIVKTQNALQKVNPKLKGGNALTYAVGLADAGANDDVFASYDTTIKSRTESASKAQRAKDYLKNSGSVEEFAQLENAVKSLGKLSDYDRGQKEDEAYAKLQRGLMSIDEYNTELDKIAYNANQSYVGKAVSLAMSGAPARAYNLYDVNARNVQKGYNLAAMGIDSRKYREMSQACDKDGNGYLKTAEIRDYVANSDVEDKATLFDALCYYPNVRNPFGTPNRYSAEQAAEMGRRSGVTQINVNAGIDNTVLAESGSSGSSYGGYGGRHYGGYGYRGGGGGMKISALPKSNYKASKQTYKDIASVLKTTRKSNSTRVANTVKVEPPTVKFKKYEV